MLDELDLYYRKSGIHSETFRCCCQISCKSAVPPNGTFTEAKSAYVGPGYENGVRPRLLFIGLDPGEGREWPNEQQRTPAAIQKKILSDPPGDKQHWWGTLRFALRILSAIDPEIRQFWNELANLQSEDCRAWTPSLLKLKQREFRDLLTPRFAHANVVRSSVGAKNSQQANEILYENCHKYLCGEIEVLKPDVIVTQGDDAKLAVEGRESRPARKGAKARPGLDGCFKGLRNGSSCQGACDPNCGSRCKVVRIAGRELIWIQTYHPAQGAGLFNKEGGNCWNCYAAAVEAFINR
jgi:hypothetical protein